MLRYLSRPPHSSFLTSFSSFSTSPLNESSGVLTKFFSVERKIEQTRALNKKVIELNRNERKKKDLQKKYGANFFDYQKKKHLVEVGGLNNMAAYSSMSFSEVENLDGYRFPDGIDYLENDDMSKLVRKCEGINLIDGKDPSKVSLLLYTVLDDTNDHISLKGDSIEPVNFVQHLKNNEMIIMNLPEDLHLIDIFEEFEKYGKIEDVEISKCVLNLPAFAKVVYEEAISVPKAVEGRHWKSWKNKMISIRTKQDAEYEHPYNRTLCVFGVPPDMSDQYLMNRLSEHGRIVEFEYTKKIENPPLPTKEQLINFLRNDPEDINRSTPNNKFASRAKIINHVIDKGIIEIYHYPQMIPEKEIQKTPKNYDEFVSRFSEQNTGEYLDSLQPIKEFHSIEFSDKSLNWCSKAEREKIEKDKILNREAFKQMKVSEKPVLSARNYGSDYFVNENGEKIAYNAFLSQLGEKEKEYYREVATRKQYDHIGHCYVTYASTDEAKLSLLLLNKVKEDDASSSPLYATLRENLFDFHLDTDFLYQNLWKLKERYRDYLTEVQDQRPLLGIAEFKENPYKNELAQIIQDVVTKDNVRKNIQTLIENQLLSKNDSWNVLVENAKKNIDTEATGRQFSLAKTERDLNRLQKLMRSNLANKMKALKSTIYDKDERLTRFLDPRSNIPVKKGIQELREIIKEKSMELYKHKLSHKTAEMIKQQIINAFQRGLNGTEKDTYDILRSLNIDPEKFETLETDKMDDIRKEIYKPLNLIYRKQELAIDSPKYKAFIEFIKDFQVLFMGHFNPNLKEQLFENHNVSSSILRTFIDTCRDVNGNEYLPIEEQRRVLEMYSPLNAEERELVLRTEEEAKMLFECLPDRMKEDLNQAKRDLFPTDILFEYDVGYPIKSFKPNVSIQDDPNFENLLKNLNKSAEFGVSYTYMNDQKHGHLIFEAVKPSFQVNVGKLGNVGLDEIKAIIIEEEKKHLKEGEEINFESKFKKIQDLLLSGRLDVKKMVEELPPSEIEHFLDKFNMSWEEFKGLIEADFGDEEVMNGIRKQMGLERLREMAKEIKKEDLMKYRFPESFTSKINEESFKKSEFTEY